MFRTLMLASLTVTAACADEFDYDPLEFTVIGNRIVAEGEIDQGTLRAFQDVHRDHPTIRVLVLQNIGGSVDDEANLELSRMVNHLGFTTLVPTDGLVASGGTDLFLAGTKRILEPGACIGVHSWAAEDFTATDIPETSPEHDRYLDYYEDIEIDPEFYWFTIEAAPAEAMHWMTVSEVKKFGIATTPVPSLSSNATCDGR